MYNVANGKMVKLWPCFHYCVHRWGQVESSRCWRYFVKSKKIKTGYLYSGTVSFTATGGYRLFCSVLPVRHLQSWPKPQCTCNMQYLGTSQARNSTNKEVPCSNYACSMLMNDDLRLPRWGIEPRPHGFREVGSAAKPLPLLSSVQLTWLTLLNLFYSLYVVTRWVTWAIHIGLDDW